MAGFFNEILYRPLFNLLILIYNILPGRDFGVAIVVLTVLIRVAFFPLSIKTIRSQKALNKLGPKMKELKEKIKDKTAQSAAIMNLYKENGVNPFSGCLPLIIQIPILIALYQAFIAGFKPESLNMLYSFVQNPGVINKTFIGLIDITLKNPVLAVLAGGLQFVQSKLATPDPGTGGDPSTNALNSQMLYFFPVMIIIIGWNLPAGLILYWIATTGFSIIEQLYIKHRG